MAKKMYVGVNNYARNVKGLWVGVNGVARKVKQAWVGDANGIARLCYTSETPTTVTFNGARGDTIQYTYNGSTQTVKFSSSGVSASTTININGDSASITFKSTKTNYKRTQTITAGVSTTVYVMPRYSVFWYGNPINMTTSYSYYRNPSSKVRNQVCLIDPDYDYSFCYEYEIKGTPPIKNGFTLTLKTSMSTSTYPEVTTYPSNTDIDDVVPISRTSASTIVFRGTNTESHSDWWLIHYWWDEIYLGNYND